MFYHACLIVPMSPFIFSRHRPYGEVRVSTQEGDVILQLWDTCGSERVNLSTIDLSAKTASTKDRVEVMV